MFRALLPLFVGMGWLMLGTTLVGFLPTRFPSPDVVLIVVIAFGFRYTFPIGGGLSFILGLLQDVLAGGIIGLNALSKTAVFSITKLIAKKFYLPNLISKIAVVLLGGIVDGLLLAVVLLTGEAMHIPLPIFFRYLILQILCTGLLAPVVFIITSKFFALSERGEGGTFLNGYKKTRARGI